MVTNTQTHTACKYNLSNFSLTEIKHKMITTKLQGAIVSCKYSRTRQCIDEKGVPKGRANLVVAQATVTSETFKTKAPELTITFVPQPTPSIKKKEMEIVERKDLPTPTSGSGKFGKFGGKFVPETLVACLTQLEHEFKEALHDDAFQVNNLQNPSAINLILLNQYLSTK